MSLIITFTGGAASSCEAFKIIDTTGEYKPVVNPNGYNAPNFLASNVDAVDLVVYDTDNVTPLPSVRLYDSATDPVFAAGFEAIVQGTAIAITGNIPSQIRRMKYMVSGVVSTVPYLFLKDRYVYLDCTHQCCADSKLADAIACGCGEGSDKMINALYIQAVINAIHAALSPSCNELAKAQELVEELDNLCKNCGCH